ncbi:saccharopine dehydrogenase [Nautilia profundicola AmH]|uniref:Saccharopine dehydrogenase n=1 Tax=Nautilia profundicola (strain ATCC BAA-1463 / DSM 18972 / AmH) TaxID=598659 RepID=B9L7P0_NAUPA|nr:saccharopine dehydrogenase family protein [Nautilia profundicola]ACM93539.1 saccharopine dehydrogenase [Nautilia profundicola AmH]
MSNLLIIGAGGVSRVATFKAAMNDHIFKKIVLASRTKSKCDAIAKDIKERLGVEIETYEIDAMDVDATAKLISDTKSDIVLNVALPYQDLAIMDACLKAGAHYVDTANYEHPDEAKFEYKEQWAKHEDFKKAGLMALLGSGFDPGVTNVFTAFAAQELLDEIEYLDILDCNAGDHGYPFATNFNPEINIREITQKGKYYENGKWKEIDPMSVKFKWNYPKVGEYPSYLLYHEELESLTKNFPSIKRARFFMTFSDNYLWHLNALQNVGMTSIEPIKIAEGCEISPMEFLKKVLPDPASLGPRTKGQTHIGVVATGYKNGVKKRYYIYNICDHQCAFREVGAQCVSYTTGVPAMIGCLMIATKTWFEAGVKNMEEFPARPFLYQLNKQGLPWFIEELPTEGLPIDN